MHTHNRGGKSLNPEIQAYGYEGLYLLRKFYGNKIPDEIE